MWYKMDKLYGDDIEIVKVNVDEQKELSAQYGIRSIPTIVLIKDKEVKHQKSGYHSVHDLDNLIQEFAVNWASVSS